MRREQDSINPRTHADVMVLAQEEEGVPDSRKHFAWYARVCGVFHAYVKLRGSDEWIKMDITRVRWFGRDMTAMGGFRRRRMDRVGFVPWDEPDAFGFLDPKYILRAVHLIPVFAHGRTDELLPGPSIFRVQQGEDDMDWRYFYVNMYVLDSPTWSYY